MLSCIPCPAMIPERRRKYRGTKKSRGAPLTEAVDLRERGIGEPQVADLRRRSEADCRHHVGGARFARGGHTRRVSVSRHQSLFVRILYINIFASIENRAYISCNGTSIPGLLLIW